MATVTRRARMPHRRWLGDTGDQESPFVSQSHPGFVPADGGNMMWGSWNVPVPYDPIPALPDSIPFIPDTSGLTVSVDQLRQQGFTSPQISLEQFIQQMQSDPWSSGNTGFVTGPGGAPEKQVLDKSGGLLAQATDGSASRPSVPTIAAPGGMSAAPAPSWLASVVAWLQSPLSANISIPRYMALAAVAAALYLMKEK